MMPLDTPLEQLTEHAAEAATILKLLANEQRLLLLCRLTQGEMSVGKLVSYASYSSPASPSTWANCGPGGWCGRAATARRSITVSLTTASGS